MVIPPQKLNQVVKPFRSRHSCVYQSVLPIVYVVPNGSRGEAINSRQLSNLEIYVIKHCNREINNLQSLTLEVTIIKTSTLEIYRIKMVI